MHAMQNPPNHPKTGWFQFNKSNLKVNLEKCTIQWMMVIFITGNHTNSVMTLRYIAFSNVCAVYVW